MKKLLVLFASAALVLSTAAVSLAAVTVGGEYKYDMYQDESVTGVNDQSYPKHELLYKISGNVSDTVFANAEFLFKHGSSGAKDFETSQKWTSEVDAFYATAKYSWGTGKMGYYEYKYTPDRQELKSGHKHVFPKTDATFEVNVPVGEGFTVDGVVAPYKSDSSDDGAYALAVNYKAENWGAKVTYADFAYDTFGDLTAFDVYYMLNEDMKLFVAAVDYSENDKNTKLITDSKKGTTQYQNNGIDGIDPVLGFVWDKIGGLKLKASVEYAINKRFDGVTTSTDPTKNEYTEYVLKAEYTLTNNISVTAYHFIKGDSCTQDKLRLKFVF